MEQWIERLVGKGIPCFPNVKGASLTTFGSGGEVKGVLIPKDERELRLSLRILADEGVPYRVMGGGSNLLLPDEGYDGAILRLSALSDWERRGCELIVGAGVKTATLARIAAEHSLSGWEFACGIPGEIGGALRQNAGAFGRMISDTLAEVTAMTAAGEKVTFSPSEIGFSYHRAAFPMGTILLSARFRLTIGDRDGIEMTMREMREKRRRTQPHFPSAGSVFRRVGDTPAALYIERTGLKGERIGGAELSPVHCNFIVNRGGARTTEYFALGEKIREKVRELCGVSLEYEVERICSRSEP